MPITHYIWDEVNDTLLMEKDEAGTTIAEYTHEPGQYGPLISQRRGGQTSFHHFDGQGSTRALTDESATVTDTYTYTAFGETVASTGTTTNPFGYKGALGYYVNPGTDEYDVLGTRYRPRDGRWLSPASFTLTAIVNGYSARLGAPLTGGTPEEALLWHLFAVKGHRHGWRPTPDTRKEWLVGLQVGGRTPGRAPNDDKPQEQAAQIAACRKYYDETVSKNPVFLRCWSVVVRAAELLLPEQRDKCLSLKVHCECCGGRGVASYRRPQHWIVLCAERGEFREGPVETAARRMCHEIIHVLQYPPCHLSPLPEDCFHTVYREMVAYYCTGECTRGVGCLPLAISSVEGMNPSPCGPGRPSADERRKLASHLDREARGGQLCPAGITPDLFRLSAQRRTP